MGEQGELVITQPMPSMPVGFWGDADGSRYRAAYFEHFPGVWRHGDWVTITERGGCMITGRSDATLNRGGVRVGTAEIYRVAEAVEGVVDSLVVHLEAADAVRSRDARAVRRAGRRCRARRPDGDAASASAMRHWLVAAPRSRRGACRSAAIPTTLSGKKLELPVKKILLGADPEAVASRGALKDPSALDEVAELAAERREKWKR